MSINGFMVVRLPHLNCLVRERDRIPHIGSLYYAGCDRMRWADVFDEDFYSKKIPNDIIPLARELREKNNDFTGLDLCQDKAVASKLLAYSNRIKISNELIAVRSEALQVIKGTVETDLEIEWMGFDFVALGEWSLIAGGIFMYPEHYSNWLTRINRFGLFDDPLLLPEYMLAYKQAVDESRSEPLAPESAGHEKIAIEMGRVQFKK